MKWNYQLKSGRALRKAIESEDPLTTLNALHDAYEELFEVLSSEFDESEIMDIFDDIDDVRDTVENYIEYDMDEDDAMDEVDGLLDKFYDLCDEYKIWVTMS